MTSALSETYTSATDLNGRQAESPCTSEITAISAQNLKRLFPKTIGYLEKPKLEKEFANAKELQGEDKEQAQLMKEVCIILDENDQPIGGATKLDSHLMANINRGLVHRAFSVFLFDSQDRLLLQQRSSTKVTFPNMWTNTCCSHPLNVPEEAGVDLTAAKQGAKRAAVRKLKDELWIKVQPGKEKEFAENFRFLTRIQYKAPNVSFHDEEQKWGEHEIDYILFAKVDIDYEANPKEVREARYVTVEELKEMRNDKSLTFTPWFTLLCDRVLFDWWPQLDDIIADKAETKSDPKIQKWL